MTDEKKGRPPSPMVQVIRRGPAPTVTPIAPTPGAPAPVALHVKPATVVPAAPKPAAATAVSSSPRSALGGFGGAGPRAPRAPSNRPPPTADQVGALAKKERVPNRIAKGDLEGKMKSRIWKKLHVEEAKRFEQAWVLVEKTPGLNLADAFGVVQSGLSLEEFAQRRARMRKRAEVKEARSAVNGERLDDFIEALVAAKTELSLVLGERTLVDMITGVQPVAFDCERGGRVEKLNVVLVTRKATWEAMSTTVTRDPRYAQKPATVSRQPSRRPINDPRAFVEQVGKKVTIALRNGISLSEPVIAVGPFDVLLGTDGNELFVPLHAMLSWVPSKVESSEQVS